MDGSGIAAAIRSFQAGDECRWDEFVRARAEGTFFHLSAWKRVIERAFGHRTYYLMCERSGAAPAALSRDRINLPASRAFRAAA